MPPAEILFENLDITAKTTKLEEACENDFDVLSWCNIKEAPYILKYSFWKTGTTVCNLHNFVTIV